jgi:hypothetical protein
MVAMTKSGLAAVDAQAKMARSVDGSIDGLRALQIAGNDAGVATDLMNGSVQMMGKRLAEAARDGVGPAHDALKLLGLDARALMEMDVDARFGLIADRINEMGMSAQDAAGVMREFGIRSNEVSLALLQGSDAIRAARGEVEKFGLSMSDDMAAGVEVANDSMSRIGFVFEAMRNQLAVGLAPVLQGLAVNFQQAIQVGGPLQGVVTLLVGSFTDLATAILDPAFIEAATMFGVTIAGAVAGLANILVVLAQNTDIAGAAMIALSGAMAFFSGPIGLAIAAVAGGVFLLSTRLGDTATAADEAAVSEAELVKALEDLDASNEAAVASGEAVIATHMDQARAAINAAKAEYALARAEAERELGAAKAARDGGANVFFGQELVDQSAEDLDQTNQYYNDLIDRREAQLDRLGKIMEGFQRRKYPSQGIRPDAPSGAGSGSGSGSGSGNSDPLGARQMEADLARLMDRIDPAAARAKQMAAAIGLLDKALAAGSITQEEYNRRVGQVNELFKEMPASSGAASAGISALKSEMERGAESGTTMADDINGALGKLINQIENGKDAFRRFGIEIIKILAIRGISKILGSGDWFSGSLIGKNALGTDNWRGGLSWVGERGPELVNLPMGAQVIPNNQLGSLGGGGMSFSYAPRIDARGASLQAVQDLDQRMRADAAKFNAKVEQAVLKAKSGRKL